jgi:hypothetical protein
MRRRPTFSHGFKWELHEVLKTIMIPHLTMRYRYLYRKPFTKGAQILI